MIAACHEMLAQSPSGELRAAYENIRTEVFGVRDSIVAMRRELQQS